MSPGFLQQPVLSLYNKLGNEDTDSSYHPLTIFLPPMAIVACYYVTCAGSISNLLPSSLRPARTRAIHMHVQLSAGGTLVNIMTVLQHLGWAVVV